MKAQARSKQMRRSKKEKFVFELQKHDMIQDIKSAIKQQHYEEQCRV